MMAHIWASERVAAGARCATRAITTARNANHPFRIRNRYHGWWRWTSGSMTDTGIPVSPVREEDGQSRTPCGRTAGSPSRAITMLAQEVDNRSRAAFVGRPYALRPQHGGSDVAWPSHRPISEFRYHLSPSLDSHHHSQRVLPAVGKDSFIRSSQATVAASRARPGAQFRVAPKTTVPAPSNTP